MMLGKQCMSKTSSSTKKQTIKEKVLNLKNTMTRQEFNWELQELAQPCRRRVSDLKGRTFEITRSEKEKGMKKSEERL